MNTKIRPISKQSAQEVVKNKIRNSIFLGSILEGEKLPPERALSQQLGVARNTLREAIAGLVDEGLIEVKRGAYGGLFVVGNAISEDDYKKRLKRSLDEVKQIFEFRLAVERVAASLAVANITQREIRKLGKLVAEMEACCATEESRGDPDNLTRFFQCDTEFHLTIAKASKNSYMLRALEECRIRLFEVIGGVFLKIDEGANDMHREIFEALAEGDEKATADAMYKHIELTFKSAYSLVERKSK